MSKHGFTLTEFIIVILLLAIIAVYLTPAWVSPGTDAQLQSLLSDIHYAQSLAITHDQRFRVNFTLPNTYSITTTSGTAVKNPDTGTNSVTLQSNVTISALSNLPNNLIAFDEKGIPYTDSNATTALSSNATITLSSNGVTRTILITPETGYTVAQ